MTTLFVDGAHGTVGMALGSHLELLLKEGLLTQVISLPTEQAKDEQARAEAFAAADVAVLCVPDAVAPSAVKLALQANPCIRILDASAAHRITPGWAYGLPELTARPGKGLARAALVANPGCFATGCILIGRPLARLMPAGKDLPWMPFQGVTGYSAAGHKGRPGPFRMAQLGKAHRHLPEIHRFAQVAPVLTTALGDWAQGMLVQTTVPLDSARVWAAYAVQYAGHPLIDLVGLGPPVHAEMNNGTNKVTLAVVEQPYGGTTIVAAYDNLGKGSAGAAADNLRRMLQ